MICSYQISSGQNVAGLKIFVGGRSLKFFANGHKLDDTHEKYDNFFYRELAQKLSQFKEHFLVENITKKLYGKKWQLGVRYRNVMKKMRMMVMKYI